MKIMVSSQIREPVTKILMPIVVFFGKLGIHPNVFTYLGVLLSIAAGVFIYLDNFLTAVILLMFGAAMDFLDGGVARYRGLATRKGGFLDSIVDRISDLAIFGGVALSIHVDLVTGIIMVTSTLLISYIRAKGESIGIEKMAVGLMERSERLLFLFFLMVISLFIPSFKDNPFFTIGNFSHGTYFYIGYMILTGLCVITVIQRFIYGTIQLSKAEKQVSVPQEVQ
ncbi:MAG: CDP-alcohol phosphatidyltransferase family protein [Candidatus Heimdallarchaeaceae archaeon]